MCFFSYAVVTPQSLASRSKKKTLHEHVGVSQPAIVQALLVAYMQQLN